MDASKNISLQTTIPQPSTSATSTKVAPAPSHLIRLPGSEWSLWRWSSLRATGFPASTVLKISTDACLQNMQSLLEAETVTEQRRQEALAALNEIFEPVRFAEDRGERRQIVKAIRSLNKNKPSAPGKFEGAVEAAMEAYRLALSEQESHAAAFRQTFKTSLAEIAKALVEVAKDKRFQEAVIWQNRRGFNTAIREILRNEAEVGRENSKHWQHLELVASYAQRYSLKNDTIGFFGPVGWARLNPEGETIDLKPGENFLAMRAVYFEAWCVDELVEILNKEKGLRPWIAPRTLPYLYVDGTTLFLPQTKPMPLPRTHAVALQLCDGRKPAKQIVASLRTRFPVEIKTDAAAYELLEFLVSRGLLVWKLELAPGMFPDHVLRELLETVEDVALRERALKPLDELEEGRQAVVRAAGDPEKLEVALNDLDSRFERITATASTRAAGEMYAARTLVFEDCRRDVEVNVGPEFLERLSPPLSLLLTSARWFTYEVGEYYRRILKNVFDGLVRETKSKQINGALFWYRSNEYFMNGPMTGSAQVSPEFQKRWAEILPLDHSQKHMHFTVAQLQPLVDAKFAAPRAGWSTGRHHSPDVMVAASSAEAMRRGDYQLVLGEFHLGVNTVRNSLFVLQHPYPDEIFQAVAADMPDVGIRIGPPKSWPGLTARTTPVLLSSENYHLLVTHDSFVQPGRLNLPIGSLIVEQSGEELIVRTRDGRLRFNIIEAFADIFSNSTTNRFKMFQPAAHLPRVSIDQLIVSRESWMFAAGEMPFAHEKSHSERFLAVRRWALEHDLPRFVFCKSPVEVKPFYVDFDSPIYVDIFLKVVRRTEKNKGPETLIAISEMVPSHDKAWLTDAKGQHYTSEFRVVAVDPR